MRKERTERILSIVFNLLIIVGTILSVAKFFVRSGDGNMEVAGIRCLRYFTVLSNILSGLTAAVILAARVREKGTVPQWVLVQKYVGTASVTLTFLTVVLFLGPTQGYIPMFSGNAFFLHLVGPLLAIFSLIFTEQGAEPLSKKHAMLAMLPCVVYGLLYLVMVVFVGWENGGWPDFYGFNIGGMWYLSLAVMYAANWLLCLLLRAFHTKSRYPVKVKEA